MIGKMSNCFSTHETTKSIFLPLGQNQTLILINDELKNKTKLILNKNKIYKIN